MLQPPVRHIGFRHDLPHDAHAGLAHAVRVAGHQWMPVRQILALVQQAVGTGHRHEVQLADIARRQPHTVGNLARAVRVIAAPALAHVVEAAGDIREFAAAVLVLQLNETAFAAVIAQRFPLFLAHLFQRFQLPEGFFVCHRLNLAAFHA